MNTLAYALLGVLSTRTLTGYQLAQRMRAPIGYMWTAQHSQIYPELAKLSAAGLVRFTVISGRGPRDTKLYQLTDVGRDALAAWADSPLPPEAPRNELLLRIRTLWLVSPERAVAFVEQQRQRYLHRLAVLTQEGAEFAGDDLLGPWHPEVFAHATLRYGLGQTRAALEWSDWLLEQLRAGAAAVEAAAITAGKVE